MSDLLPTSAHAAFFYQREAALNAHYAINLLSFAQGAHDYHARRGYELEAIAYQNKAATLYRLARHHMRVEARS